MASPPLSGTLTVLVIDDEPQIRRVVHNAFIAAPLSIPGDDTADGVPVRVRMRRIPDVAFASHDALREALDRAPAEFLTGVARAGSAA
jgi:hypothetical protein